MKKVALLFAALLAYMGMAIAAVNINSATKEQLESLGPVTRVGICLGCDRAHMGCRPRYDRAHREKLRLGCDAPLAGTEIAGADRVGRDDRSVSHR